MENGHPVTPIKPQQRTVTDTFKKAIKHMFMHSYLMSFEHLTTSFFNLNAIVAFDWLFKCFFLSQCKYTLLMFLIYVLYSVLHVIPKRCLSLWSAIKLVPPLKTTFLFRWRFPSLFIFFSMMYVTILKTISNAIFYYAATFCKSRVLNVDDQTMTLTKYTSTIQ